MIQEPSMIWEILIQECGAQATPSALDSFRYALATRVAKWPFEYHFQSKLGPGGTLWLLHDSIYVTCYPEEMTPERQAMIDAANARFG